MTGETKIHLILSLLQTAALVGFVVYADVMVDVKPSEVRNQVSLSSQELLSEIAVLRADIDSYQASVEAKQVWIEQVSKSLSEINVELIRRADWMDGKDAKWQELEAKTDDRFTGEDFRAHMRDHHGAPEPIPDRVPDNGLASERP